MSVLQAFILGAIQGLTEFLPISSSGHLIIIPKLFHWPLQPLAFDVVLHIGTLLAVIFYFKKDLWKIIHSALFFKDPAYTKERYLIAPLIIGILPATIAGFLLNNYLDSTLRSSRVITSIVIFNLILWGVFLIAADWYEKKGLPAQKNPSVHVKISQSLVIGLFQIFSLIPGTSRSGVTIGAGIFAKLSKEEAARFSFLMSVPLIFGAGLLKIKDLAADQAFSLEVVPLIVGLFTSAIVGWFAIALLMKVLKHFGLTIFGIYRIVLAGVLLIVL